jgi:hypothetical protein
MLVRSSTVQVYFVAGKGWRYRNGRRDDGFYGSEEDATWAGEQWRDRAVALDEVELLAAIISCPEADAAKVRWQASTVTRKSA